MKVLRWILMFPGGLVAAVLVSIIVSIFTKPLGIDAYYFTTFFSYAATIITAAFIAPKHRLGTIVSASVVTFILVGAALGSRLGLGSARQRSHNLTLRTTFALIGTAVGVVSALHRFKDEEVPLPEVEPQAYR